MVLNYISNESKRFKVFVTNPVQMIRNNTNLSQWNYVRSADNPADSASRGLNSAKEAKIKWWFEGPVFFEATKRFMESKTRDWPIRNRRSRSEV